MSIVYCITYVTQLCAKRDFTLLCLFLQFKSRTIHHPQNISMFNFFFSFVAEINDPYPRSKYHSLMLLLPHLSRINLFLALFLIYVCALLHDKQIARILMMRLIVYKHWVSLQKCWNRRGKIAMESQMRSQQSCQHTSEIRHIIVSYFFFIQAWMILSFYRLEILDSISHSSFNFVTILAEAWPSILFLVMELFLLIIRYISLAISIFLSIALLIWL